MRSFISDRPHRQSEWLALVEFWFNTNFHTAIKLTPYETLYGIPPPKLIDYIFGLTKAEAMESYMSTRAQILEVLKQNLIIAQERMNFQADKHRSERSFEVGDWVYLRLQPYRQQSLTHQKSWKLSPKLYGPF